MAQKRFGKVTAVSAPRFNEEPSSICSRQRVSYIPPPQNGHNASNPTSKIIPNSLQALHYTGRHNKD